MRCVDYRPDDIAMPEEVVELRHRLSVAEHQQVRKALIDDNSHIWANAKPALRKAFFGKCWYTESPQEGTDVDVDHYRPKKRVAMANKGQEIHPGYWWLAFSPENFRYSCIVANRRRRDVQTGIVGGKADYFPLWNEKKRALAPEDDISEEEPLLLDPCKPGDVGLITYRDDGEAMPRISENESKKAFKRAAVSINLYHLNHTDFVKARVRLREKLVELVREAKRAFDKLDSGDAFHATTYENAISELRQMRKEDAPYSGFCVAYLDRVRHKPFLAGVHI